jgi:hypothetical protein
MSKISFPKRKKRKKERGPIPYVVSLELAFLPEGMEEDQYEDEVRRMVKDKIPQILRERKVKTAWTPNSAEDEDFLFEEYDERVSDIIEQEILRN